MSESPHNPCAACGACCRSYLVPLCGYDIWLISTQQRLSPEQFVVAYPLQEQGIDRFKLQADSTTSFMLMLDKQGPLEITQPCVFLLQLADGTTRCGIYDQRPVTCRSYPMTMWKHRVMQRKDVLCPPDSWPETEVQRPAWRLGLKRFLMHFDIYHEVVTRWNARVARNPKESFTFEDFYSYLLNVYDRLDALNKSIGAARLALVESSWPNAPRPTLDDIKLQAGSTEMPWLEYLTQARRVIDSFYSQIPPLPLLFLAPVYDPGPGMLDEDFAEPTSPGATYAATDH